VRHVNSNTDQILCQSSAATFVITICFLPVQLLPHVLKHGGQKCKCGGESVSWCDEAKPSNPHLPNPHRNIILYLPATPSLRKFSTSKQPPFLSTNRPSVPDPLTEQLLNRHSECPIFYVDWKEKKKSPICFNITFAT
jgi:hypothetical protein